MPHRPHRTSEQLSTTYLWQLPDWPKLRFDFESVSDVLLDAHDARGVMRGVAQAIGMPALRGLEQEILTGEALATAAIEGEKLDLAAVRSSVLRRLGEAGTGPISRHVDGLVEVLQDATVNFDEPLDVDRLCRWQSALFPGGTAGIRRIAVGRFRDHEDPMQIVSGPIGKEVVHYTAPPSSKVPREMAAFLRWFAKTRPTSNRATRRKPEAIGKAPGMDGIARAAIAHLWFETIHPFEDGNGRVGRAIADMAIAQDLGDSTRLHSLSRQLLADRRGYYDALANAQRGDTDVTAFVDWFARAFAASCARSTEVMMASIKKSRFLAAHAHQPLNVRQRSLVGRLLEAGDGGFLGGLNIEKYLKFAKTSKATATRDLATLVAMGMLHTEGRGKALRYYLSVPGWQHGNPKSESDLPEA